MYAAPDFHHPVCDGGPVIITVSQVSDDAFFHDAVLVVLDKVTVILDLLSHHAASVISLSPWDSTVFVLNLLLLCSPFRSRCQLVHITTC